MSSRRSISVVLMILVKSAPRWLISGRNETCKFCPPPHAPSQEPWAFQHFWFIHLSPQQPCCPISISLRERWAYPSHWCQSCHNWAIPSALCAWPAKGNSVRVDFVFSFNLTSLLTLPPFAWKFPSWTDSKRHKKNIPVELAVIWETRMQATKTQATGTQATGCTNNQYFKKYLCYFCHLECTQIICTLKLITKSQIRLAKILAKFLFWTLSWNL